MNSTLDPKLIKPYAISYWRHVTLAMIFMICYIIAYTNSLIYYLVAVSYPILYNMHLFNQNPKPTDDLMKVSKYWILLMSLNLVEAVIGFMLYFVPLYSYIKIGFLYALIRNDFYLADYLFWFLGGIIGDIEKKYGIIGYLKGFKLD